MTPLQITVTDLTDALRDATAPKPFASRGPVKFVEDADTGERVGWISEGERFVEWRVGHAGGTVPTPEAALERIRDEVLAHRRMAAENAAYDRAIAAMPADLRELYVEMANAAVALEIERMRNVIRVEDEKARRVA